MSELATIDVLNLAVQPSYECLAKFERHSTYFNTLYSPLIYYSSLEDDNKSIYVIAKTIKDNEIISSRYAPIHS